jgi:hypothetical protein
MTLPRLHLGCGSAYANDRLEPAAQLADSGRVGYLGFDCLAERTMALAQLRRRADPAAGQDERIQGVNCGWLRIPTTFTPGKRSRESA